MQDGFTVWFSLGIESSAVSCGWFSNTCPESDKVKPNLPLKNFSAIGDFLLSNGQYDAEWIVGEMTCVARSASEKRISNEFE